MVICGVLSLRLDFEYDVGDRITFEAILMLKIASFNQFEVNNFFKSINI